jgi:hypothetical protein
MAAKCMASGPLLPNGRRRMSTRNTKPSAVTGIQGLDELLADPHEELLVGLAPIGLAGCG